MAKIKSMEELLKIKEAVKSQIVLREQGENIDELIQVKVGLATCGIASGAREIMDYILTRLAKDNLSNVVVTQTGCLGHCDQEPIIEVTIPGEEAVIYGEVTKEKVDAIIDKHILKGEVIDGVIIATK